MNTFELDKNYIMNTYGRLNLEIASGKGSTLYSADGKEYIDFGTGIAVNTFGASDSEWVEAVSAQLGKIQHTSNYYYTEPCAVLAKMLCDRTGMTKVFFGNSGAEANECAIKAARKYGTDRDENKNVIITLKNSFHGRTVTTLAATGQEVFHKHFTPFTEGFVYVGANNIEELERAANENNCCAVMMELIQGEGGVMTLDGEFVRAAVRLAEEKDMLVIIDEVQTGNGRTGTLYAYEQFGIKPDIVTTAKGLGGGLPIGATMFSAKLDTILPKSSHGSTFGGNPVCAAGAVNIISRIDDEMLGTVRENSEYLIGELRKIKGVRAVSGMGYMLGVEIDGDAAEVMTRCLEKGLLVLTAKTKVRLLPALNISREEIDKGLSILKEVIEG